MKTRPLTRDVAEAAFAKEIDRFTLSGEGCWLWNGPTFQGYGKVFVDGWNARIHRLTYILFRGPIPEGLTLDHGCRVRNCANPWHLEPATNRENVLRGIGVTATNAGKTHCFRGHEFTAANTHIRQDPYKRVCIACRRELGRRRRHAAKAKA